MTSETLPAAGRDRTRAAIVDAAARLLAEGGHAAVTTRGVAQAAGVQAPAIYRLFGDKDGLIAAVAEHVMTSYVGGEAAALDAAAQHGTDPVADLRAGWDTHVEFGLANPLLYGTLFDTRREHASEGSEDGLGVLRARIRRVAAAGLLRVPEDRAVALVHAAGSGVVFTLNAAPPALRTGLADAAWDMVRDAILTDRPATTGDGPVSAATAARAVAGELPGLTEAERTLLGEWLDRTVAAAVAPPAPSRPTPAERT